MIRSFGSLIEAPSPKEQPSNLGTMCSVLHLSQSIFSSPIINSNSNEGLEDLKFCQQVCLYNREYMAKSQLNYTFLKADFQSIIILISQCSKLNLGGGGGGGSPDSLVGV